jgi:hypothetical protein
LARTQEVIGGEGMTDLSRFVTVGDLLVVATCLILIMAVLTLTIIAILQVKE